MNKYQRLVIVVALMNALIMLLFPPFTSQPLAKGMLPGFDGFYPIFTQIGSKPLFKELLSLQLIFLGINAMAGWLVLQGKKHHDDIPDFSFMQAIGWFTLVNLAIIFTFPPFEPYQSLLRADAGGFDSFYFILGSRSQRAIFWPLLYLECLFIFINALGLVLLFNTIKRSDDEARRRLMQLTDDLPDNDIARITEEIQLKIKEQIANASAPLGRSTDRRRSPRAARTAVSNERRTGDDRRGQ